MSRKPIVGLLLLFNTSFMLMGSNDDKQSEHQATPISKSIPLIAALQTRIYPFAFANDTYPQTLFVQRVNRTLQAGIPQDLGENCSLRTTQVFEDPAVSMAVACHRQGDTYTQVHVLLLAELAHRKKNRKPVKHACLIATTLHQQNAFAHENTENNKTLLKRLAINFKSNGYRPMFICGKEEKSTDPLLESTGFNHFKKLDRIYDFFTSRQDFLKTPSPTKKRKSASPVRSHQNQKGMVTHGYPQRHLDLEDDCPVQ